MSKYRILEVIDYWGVSLYRPQKRYGLFFWHGWWNNPMDKEPIQFGDMEEAIDFIQDLKNKSVKTYNTYNLNR